MGKWTKGPWRKVEDWADGAYHILTADGHPLLTTLSATDEDAANAQLATAAPDLAEALEDLLSYATQLELLEYGPDEGEGARHATIIKAAAALAKARGEGV